MTRRMFVQLVHTYTDLLLVVCLLVLCARMSSSPARSYFTYAPLDHFVAGISAGFVATLVLHPFDVIKIRMQVTQQHRHRHIHIHMT